MLTTRFDGRVVIEGHTPKKHCVLQDSADGGATWRICATVPLPECAELVEGFKRGTWTLDGGQARPARRIGYYDKSGKLTSIWSS